jgi:YcxB-like protein
MDMVVDTTFLYDPDQHAAALRDAYRASGARRTRWAIALGVPLAMTALTFAGAPDDPLAAFWSVVPYWVLFPFLGLGMLPLQRRWAARALPKRDPTVLGPQRRVLDTAGLQVGGNGVHLSFDWAGIQRVLETPAFFLFFFSKGSAYYIPKSALSGAQVEGVRGLVAAHLSADRPRMLSKHQSPAA